MCNVSEAIHFKVTKQPTVRDAEVPRNPGFLVLTPNAHVIVYRKEASAWSIHHYPLH